MEVTANIYTTPLTVTHNGDTVVLKVQKFTPNPFYVNLISNLQTTTDFTNKTVLGFYEPYDGGGGEFYWDASNASEPIHGMIIESDAHLVGRWIRIIENDTYNLLFFGAVGDGSTDNYEIIHTAVDYINDSGYGKLIIPFGDFFVDQYATVSNGIVDFDFLNLSWLIIEGDGKISFKGDFVRDAITTRGLSGFRVLGCSNVQISGIELNGNCQETDKNVQEEYGTHGIYLGGGENFILKNIHVHHFASDGIYIKDYGTSNPRLAVRNVYGENIISEYNGRQGMSIIQLRGGMFLNCSFNYTGMSAYGDHSPAAGVDIEPNRDITTTSPNQMDVNTGDITFDNCKFICNYGASFLSAYYNRVDTVKVLNCEFDVVNETATGGTDGFIIDVANAIVDNCKFNMRAVKIAYLGFEANTISSIIVTNSEFRGGAKMVASGVNVKLDVNNNRFISTASVPHDDLFLQIQNSKATFINNYVFIPQAGFVDQGVGDRHAAVIMSCISSRNNIFETDLTRTYLSNTHCHYYVTYSSSSVQNDKFNGTEAGLNNTFRPSLNSPFDTTYPYSQGIKDLGLGFTMGPHNLSRLFIWGTAAPTTGLHFIGERVINSSTSVNFIDSWVCVAAGTRGTWKPIQLLLSGTTAARPTVSINGFIYFDTTLGKPIWKNGANWVDATGTTV